MDTIGTATYSPEDNKLRMTPYQRLDADTYARVRGAGFIWAPKQELFVAPMWTPFRADLLEELCGEIGDEDSNLVDRAEDRAERFEGYSERRADDAEAAHKAVSAIADNIPLGQPILVGHHSERHARRDAEKIENGMRKAVKMWETSKYWQDRAAGAIRHAKYKERPDVRARRIKGIEADKRKAEKATSEANNTLAIWRKVGADITATKTDGTPATARDIALYVANREHISKCLPLADFPRDPPASQYEGMMSLWSALTDNIITAEQARDVAIRVHERSNAHRARWIAHYENRLAYERAMLAEGGGTIAERTGPEKGGAVRCWASHRGGWSFIQKVNKVTVTVLDNWGNGGGNFTRNIPFDKLQAVMTAAQVREARVGGLLVETADKTGFFLRARPDDDTKEETPDERRDRAHREHLAATAKPEPTEADFAAMKETLRHGVRVVSAPQLFPTPIDVAQRMADMAGIEPGQEVLEPSAGTGALLDAIQARGGKIFAVEINHRLAEALASKYATPEDAAENMCRNVLQADFLECNGNLGAFDRIIMNPPFENGSDIKHIEHARKMLKPGGRLVAICANGPRQGEKLRPLCSLWEDLPPGTFAGTGVHAALIVIEA